MKTRKDTPVAHIRLSKELMRRIDKLAAEQRRPRAQMITLLVEEALQAKDQTQAASA